MQRLRMIPNCSKDIENFFGMNDLQDRLKAFCLEQGLEVPAVRLIEMDGVLMPYAVPLHLVRDDQMGQYDIVVVFLLADFPDREAETERLKVMAEEFERPCLLTTKAAFSTRQDGFYKSLGFMRMPITWEDEAQRDYEVYMKGQLEICDFVGLMEQVEYIGKEIVYSDNEEQSEV